MSGRARWQWRSEYVRSVKPLTGIRKKCNGCGKARDIVFFNKDSAKKDGLQAKCSACYRKYNRKQYLSKYPKGKHGDEISKKCEVCGREFTTTKKQQIYCSLTCRRKPRTTGIGLIKKPAREYFCEKHSFTCQKCGSVGDNSDLHVHHITPLCLGGENIEDNLTVLCADCHRKEHAILNRSPLLRVVYRVPTRPPIVRNTKRRTGGELQSADLFQ